MFGIAPPLRMAPFGFNALQIAHAEKPIIPAAQNGYFS
jgi:hypothetical protein